VSEGWDDLGSWDDVGPGEGRVRPGDGAPLPAFRPSWALTRTRFVHRGESSSLIVDVDHDAQRAQLYRDGRRIAVGEMPARFAVPEGSLEVSASMHGMRRVHLLTPDGAEHRLEPAARTPEGRRASFARTHPAASRVVAFAAVAVLLVDLALLAPQLIEFVTHLDLWPSALPQFTSPVVLPAWLNTALTAAGAVIDAETDGVDP
jgi:hypothetical protein